MSERLCPEVQEHKAMNEAAPTIKLGRFRRADRFRPDVCIDQAYSTLSPYFHEIPKAEFELDIPTVTQIR